MENKNKTEFKTLNTEVLRETSWKGRLKAILERKTTTTVPPENPDEEYTEREFTREQVKLICNRRVVYLSEADFFWDLPKIIEELRGDTE